MGQSRDLTGSRLGPYHLDKRYEDLDEPGGQLYAAHHVETGRPALVLVPEPQEPWAPRSDWSARVTSQASPPYLATELERPPPPDADALTDVDLAFIRMAGAIACVEDREDAHADFTRPPVLPLNVRGAWRRPDGRHVRTGTLVAGVLVLGALVLWPRLQHPARKGAVTPHAPETEPTSFIDGQAIPFPLFGYPMPQTPFKEQMKPPCSEEAYVDVKGGCWVLMKQDAPCPKGSAEYEGKCYVPVREKKPEPRSVKP